MVLILPNTMALLRDLVIVTLLFCIGELAGKTLNTADGYESYPIPFAQIGRDIEYAENMENPWMRGVDPFSRHMHKARRYFGSLGHKNMDHEHYQKHSRTKYKILGIPFASKHKHVDEHYWGQEASETAGGLNWTPVYIANTFDCPTCFVGK